MSLGVGVGLLGAGSLVSAAGSLQAGKAARALGSYQAEVARNNAVTAEQNADYALKAGAVEAQTESLKGAVRLGAVKAAQGASGVDVNTGSAVDVQESEREKGALDTETTMHNAILRAYGYRTQATNFEAEAGLREAEGIQAEKASRYAALGTLLSGAGGATAVWYGK